VTVTVGLSAFTNVTDADPTPPLNVTAVGYVGAAPAGAFAGPVNTRACEPVKLVAVLPDASCAVIETENAAPAVWLDGVGTENFEATPALTVKLPVLPATAPAVSVRVVLSAFTNVTDAEPTPLVKVTEVG
jgi:hypothetical protein